MKYFTCVFICCLISACTTPEIVQQPIETPVNVQQPVSSHVKHEKPKDVLQTYREAVDRLAEKITTGIKTHKGLQRVSNNQYGQLRGIITNANGQDKERMLSLRFIRDLQQTLINRGYQLQISKKERMIPSHHVQGNQNQRLYDYLVHFSLLECPQETNCAEAGVQVVDKSSGDIICMASELFVLEGNVLKWMNTYMKRHKNSTCDKGYKKKPYLDMLEASRCMLNHLHSKMKKLVPSLHDIRIMVKGTSRTPESCVDFFIGALSESGMIYIPTEKWLSVVVKSQDQFEMELYPSEHTEELSTANVVLGVDMQTKENGMFFIRIKMFTVRTINIVMASTQNKRILAGSAIPGCSSRGYLIADDKQEKIQASGFGNCNKGWPKNAWKYSAMEAAKLDAKANLAAQIESYIFKKSDLSKKTLMNQGIKTYVHAIIRDVAVLENTFYKQTCTATAIMETKKSNIISLLKEPNHYPDINNKTHAEIPKNKSHRPEFIVKQSAAPSFVHSNHDTISDSQQIMIDDTLQYIRKRLRDKSIVPEVINWVSITGKIGLPDCRVEDHYLSENLDVPPRNYCQLSYQLILHIQEKEMLVAKGRANGRGSNQNTAWKDALFGIGDQMFPLIYDIALAISDERFMEQTYQSLKKLDDQLWRFTKDLSVESMVDDIESLQKELDSLYN